MIRLNFPGGFALIPNLGNYSHIFGNGDTRTAFRDGLQVDNYILLNDKAAPEPSYVDICETVGEECVVTEHLPVTSAEVDTDIYDEAFAEMFAYEADERAMEDDLQCALLNENNNVSHWRTVQECDLSDKDRRRCQEIFEIMRSGRGDDGQHKDEIDEFGSYIAREYEAAILEKKRAYQKTVMEMARDAFLSELNVL